MSVHRHVSVNRPIPNSRGSELGAITIYDSGLASLSYAQVLSVFDKVHERSLVFRAARRVFEALSTILGEQ